MMQVKALARLLPHGESLPGTMEVVMRTVARSLAMLAALFVFALAGAPAHAAYCEDIAWTDAHHPDGECLQVYSARINWGGGTSVMRLLLETEARAGLSPARLLELRRIVDEAAAASGPAIARLGGARLPPTVHLVVVNDTRGATTYAETVRRTDGQSDCPMMVFGSAGLINSRKLLRTIAHELFHCVQYETWPAKMSVGPSARWWAEGSAEWFEDYALPGDAENSDLLVSLRLFRERAGIHSILEGTNSNAVLFSWLGASRVASFISGLAEGGESQLTGAGRAMSVDEWQRFAQDYIDERVRTPSGITLAGAEFVPPLALLHTTTGRPGEDPVYEAPRAAPPLTLMSGRIEFVPGEYAPTGQFGTRRTVFSERPGGWGMLPSPLRVDCAGMKKIRIAGLSLTEARLRVDPGTRTASPRECGCPVGNWTIPEEGLMQFAPHNRATLVSHGEVTMRFDPGGTARFVARNLVFDLPEIGNGTSRTPVAVKVQISRTYEGSWSWSTSGDRITMNAIDLMRTTERTTHTVRGPAPLGGVHTQPARSRTIESDNHDGRPKQFSCEGDRLKITDPINRVGVNRWHIPSMDNTRYPRSGVFVRQ